MEPNDTILLATPIDLDSSFPLTVPDVIDDNNDVDLFKVELETGDTLGVDINAEITGSTLDSVLRVFGANGNQLAFNDDAELGGGGFEPDPNLTFTASLNGTYYVGVSSAPNEDYDPNVEDSGTEDGESSGDYDLVLTYTEATPPVDEVYNEANDTLQSANVIEFDSSSRLEIFGAIGDTPAGSNDVDLFRVELNARNGLLADINAANLGSTLDSVITIFNANGNPLFQVDNNVFEGQTELDPFFELKEQPAGTYYVGISSAPNLNYDPNVADSGTGDSSGNYRLVLTLDIDSEPNDDISNANVIEFDSSSPVVVDGQIGDNIFPNPALNANDDVDLFEVELKAGDTLTADINSDTSLSSALTIFDATGEELVQNVDESLVEFIVDQDGTYYVGVSSSGNTDYDPNVAGSGTGDGDSSGSYSLELELDRISSDLFTAPIIRFQNNDRPGTYLFAGEGESEGIRANFPNFSEEGQAFKVAVESGDDLIRINRFQNLDVPGTYLYAGEGESEGIRANFPNFSEEGIAFYVYPGSADIGVDFYRFQNLDFPGTYVFVGEEERQNILANFPNFAEEGVAFEVEI